MGYPPDIDLSHLSEEERMHIQQVTQKAQMDGPTDHQTGYNQMGNDQMGNNQMGNNHMGNNQMGNNHMEINQMGGPTGMGMGPGGDMGMCDPNMGQGPGGPGPPFQNQ